MVDHKSTGLLDRGPTESSAPEPCWAYVSEHFKTKKKMYKGIFFSEKMIEIFSKILEKYDQNFFPSRYELDDFMKYFYYI